MRTMIDWSFKEIKKMLPKDPEALLAFKLPAEYQERIHELLEMNREGILSAEDREEMKAVFKLEGKILRMKAKVLEKQNREQ